MRKAHSWFLVLGSVAAMTIVAGACGGVGKPTNVILIGWDGAQRNHVKECLTRKELPNLKRLAGEGTLVAIDIARVTDTKAGWAQILTGYEPEATGVYSNRKYQPIPEGYTVFERLEKHFGPDEFVTVAVIGKKGNVGAGPPRRIPANRVKDQKRRQQLRKSGARMIEKDGVKHWKVPGQPFYNAQKNMDLFVNGLALDDKVGKKTLDLLDKHRDKPFFFFVHFAEVDHQGHKFGENSKEYNDAIISADTWTGKIMDRLEKLDLYDKTLIYVTADHGFDEGLKGHSDAPYVFLGTNDPEVMRRGERVEVAPTILERFGLDLDKIEPPLDGVPLTKPKPIW